jgi:hypothetical protein
MSSAVTLISSGTRAQAAFDNVLCLELATDLLDVHRLLLVPKVVLRAAPSTSSPLCEDSARILA